MVSKKIEGLVSEAGIPGAPTLAHQMGLLIDGAVIAAMVVRNPKVAGDAGTVMRVLIDTGKPAARRIAPPKLRVRQPVDA